jgi:hypothetical protein
MPTRTFLNRSREQWALLQASGVVNDSVALFVHGFRGSYLTTWGRLPNMLSENADASAPFASWDYLFVGYNTGQIETYLDISRLLISQWRLAESGAAPFGRPYKRLALFGHSLGTLGIRQMLCAWAEHSPQTLSSIHSVTLFGSPLNGSVLARFALSYRVRHALKRRNPQLRMLKTWSAGAYAVRPWPPIRIILGLDDRVVGNRYAELVVWDGDAPVDLTTLNHGDLVKPNDWIGSVATSYLARGLQ